MAQEKEKLLSEILNRREKVSEILSKPNQTADDAHTIERLFTEIRDRYASLFKQTKKEEYRRDAFYYNEQVLRMRPRPMAARIPESLPEEAAFVPKETDSTVDFENVIGMRSVLETFNDAVIRPVVEKEAAKIWSVEIGGGILLYGPPGCGKTYLGKAVAGQLGKSIRSHSHFFYIKSGDWLSKWRGETDQRIIATYTEAKNKAGNDGVSIIFLDEFDALAPSRSYDSADSADIRQVSTLLAELEGFAERGNVITLAATNYPWAIDPAVLRPGRFNDVIFIEPPDLEARAGLFAMHIGKVPGSKSLDYNSLASHTEGFSPADIKGICHRAKRVCFAGYIRDKKTEVNMSLIERLLAEKGGRTTIKPWLGQATDFFGRNEYAKEFFGESIGVLEKYANAST